MPHAHSQGLQSVVLHVLLLLKRPCALDDLAGVLHMSAAQMLAFAHNLPSASCLYVQQGQWHVRSELVPGSGLLQGGPRVAAADFPLLHQLQEALTGDTLGGLDGLLDQAMVLLDKHQWGSLVLLCDLCTQCLRRENTQGFSYEQARRYTYLCLAFMEVYFMLGYRPLNSVTHLYARAKKAAVRVGDIRISCVLDIFFALYISMRYYRKHKGSSRNIFLRTLRKVEMLGDEDIASLIVDFKIIHYATQGDIQQCISAYTSRTVTHALPWRSCYVQACSAVVSAAASVYGGRIFEGFAVLEDHLRSAIREKKRHLVEWMRVQMANLLLNVGLTGQALEHLEAMGPCISAIYQPILFLLLSRTLAYYHYKNGNIHASYAVFRQGVHEASASRGHAAYYGYPWFLELLYAYHRQGFASLPGYDLQQEVDRLILAENVNLRGAALRYKAMLLREQGREPEALLELLHTSFEELNRIDNRRELGLTRLELASVLEQAGRRLEAQTHRQLGRQALASAALPDEANENLLQQELGQRIAEVAQWEQPWNSREGYYNWFARLVQYVLQVERVALWCDQGGLHFLSGCHISAEDMRGGEFAQKEGQLLRFLRENPSAVHIWNNNYFCAKFTCKGVTYGLYADNTCLSSVFRNFVPAHLEQAVAFFGLHFSLAVNMLGRQTAAVDGATVAARAKEAPPYFDQSLREVQSVTTQAAESDAPVLILGETGVGKELLARRIHEISGRSGPFVPIHLAGISESLFESEFFGHEKGAFTGANQQKIGLVEMAHKGTLFIDEVGDVPLALQVKLLRVLQDYSFVRVGGTRTLRSDFRVVSATHRKIPELIAEGLFREDLYYRISVIPITLPPLRSSGDRIVQLTQNFLQHFAKRYHKPLPALDVELEARLRSHHWPGNIRELKSAVERAMILYDGGPLDILPFAPRQAGAGTAAQLLHDLPPWDVLQKRYLEQVLQKTGHKICGPHGAETVTGMKRSTLYVKIKELGLKGK